MHNFSPDGTLNIKKPPQ